MASLEDKLDLTQYDYNDDGCIDGIYLIYSAPVDYESDDSIFWAFTTWYIVDESENQTFDNMDVYAYCFMGFDFMDEATDDEGTTIAVNAATYIHETGHMLGLDDYYDYYQDEGSNKGLGAADMMDSTVGDHNPYSKLMMGWVTPTVVTATETITLSDFATSGQFIMILLDYNGTYFSEYLLIDLYSAKGLNELHADVALSYLYDGEAYGVRVFHVSSEIDTPYEGDDYASFTKYNNSISEIPLIYLVEADGDKNYESSPYEDCCEADDLWQAGDKLSAIFPGYTRNDGARVNFDITINAVSADTADITITFAE